MIQCLLAVCSDSGALDFPSQRLSIFHVIEDAWAISFPVVLKLQATFVLSREEGDPAQPQTALRIFQGRYGEDTVPVEVNFRAGLRTRALVQLEGVPLRGPGIVRFGLLVEGRDIGGWEIVVHERPLPGPQATTVQEPPPNPPLDNR
jgi:hypothetical protein